MKKFMSMLLLVVMVVSLVGCGEKSLKKAESNTATKNISESVNKVATKATDVAKEKNEFEKPENDSDKEIISEETITSAMFVPVNDWNLFMNETGPFTLLGENIEYLDIDENVISETDLTAGNKVEITSSGMMLMSYPGQLAGVTKVQITEVGSPDDVAEYQEIIDEFSNVNNEETDVPVMNISYKNDSGDISMMVEANGGYSLYNDEDALVGDAQPIEEVVDSLPVANIGEKADLEFTFSKDTVSITVWKVTEEGETQLSESENGVFADIVPATYYVQAEFANGDAEYRFVCKP